MNLSKLNISVKGGKGEIIFVLDGRIDANASENFKNVVMSQIQSKKVNSVIFDCENLEYVSSSGLRVFLSLKQKEKVKLKFINISDEVYDIFEVTGFSQILDISRKIHDISDSKGQLIAESNDMIMYQMDDEKIMKLYPHGTELKDVEHELNLTKTALLSGIPTLISYFIVMYKGRYGIIYEMPNAKPVSSMIEFQKWKLDSYAKEMGKTLRLIHSCEPDINVMPKTSETFTKYAAAMRNFYNDEEFAKLFSMIRAIPAKTTAVFENYYPNNIFMQGDELILINMSGISCGNPIFDLGKLYMIYILEPEKLLKRLTGLELSQGKRFFTSMLEGYFENEKAETIERYKKIIPAMGYMCLSICPAICKLSDKENEMIVSRTRRDVLPAFNTIVNLLKQA